MRAACTFLEDSPECYTATWFLIWDQIRYWLLLQVPNIVISVLYEWLEVSNSARIEKLRLLLTAPFPVVVVLCKFISLVSLCLICFPM